MQQHHEENWQINLPDDWISETEEECVSIYHPNGPGMLEISASLQPEIISDDDLMALTDEHLEKGAHPEKTTIGDFSGIELSYEDDGVFWREWYLRQGELLLFATYNCDTGDEEKEEGMLDVILATLRRQKKRD